MPSAGAGKTALASTGGATRLTPVAVSPLMTKSRRVIVMRISLQVELRAGEQRIPPVGRGRRGVEHCRGVCAQHTVELVLHALSGIREDAVGRNRRGGEVDARQPRGGRDPSRV